MSSPTIEQGRAALRDGDAATAHHAFKLALAEVEWGEALEGLAEALYLERESRYRRPTTSVPMPPTVGKSERGRRPAARALAWITGNIFGEWAVQSGWWARARDHP